MKAVLISALVAGAVLSPAVGMAQDASSAARQAVDTAKGAMGMRGGPMTKEQHRQNSQEMFKEMDKDGNGSISQQEFMASHEGRFDRMDTNKDGTVSPDEHRAQRGKPGRGWE